MAIPKAESRYNQTAINQEKLRKFVGGKIVAGPQDNLLTISAQTGVPHQVIAQLNGIQAVTPGQTLKLPPVNYSALAAQGAYSPPAPYGGIGENILNFLRQPSLNAAFSGAPPPQEAVTNGPRTPYPAYNNTQAAVSTPRQPYPAYNNPVTRGEVGFTTPQSTTQHYDPQLGRGGYGHEALISIPKSTFTPAELNQAYPYLTQADITSTMQGNGFTQDPATGVWTEPKNGGTSTTPTGTNGGSSGSSRTDKYLAANQYGFDIMSGKNPDGSDKTAQELYQMGLTRGRDGSIYVRSQNKKRWWIKTKSPQSSSSGVQYDELGNPISTSSPQDPNGETSRLIVWRV